MKRSTLFRLMLASLSVLGLAACQHEKPNFIFMPDMHHSPAYKAQEEGAMRLPPKGTVPQGYQPYHYTDNAAAGRELRNPLARNKKTLLRGQVMYNTYCIVCHGPAGMGDGTIVPPYPRPPSLQSDKIRAYADGNIFDVITRGQNLMPSYASQIVVEDRWAIIHYIRALHRSQKPTPEDLKAFEQAQQ